MDGSVFVVPEHYLGNISSTDAQPLPVLLNQIPWPGVAQAMHWLGGEAGTWGVQAPSPTLAPSPPSLFLLHTFPLQGGNMSRCQVSRFLLLTSLGELIVCVTLTGPLNARAAGRRLLLGVSRKMFPEHIIIRIWRLSKDDPSQGRWAASHPLRAWIEQKVEEGWICFLWWSWDLHLWPLDVFAPGSRAFGSGQVLTPWTPLVLQPSDLDWMTWPAFSRLHPAEGTDCLPHGCSDSTAPRDQTGCTYRLTPALHISLWCLTLCVRWARGTYAQLREKMQSKQILSQISFPFSFLPSGQLLPIQ